MAVKGSIVPFGQIVFWLQHHRCCYTVEETQAWLHISTTPPFKSKVNESLLKQKSETSKEVKTDETKPPLNQKVWVPQRSGERRQKVAMLWAAKLCRQRLEAEDQEKSWHRWPSAVKSVCNANITVALDRQPTGRLALQKQKRGPKYGQGN